MPTTSATTPADGYVLPGCIAFAAHLHAQRMDAASALLLLHLVRDDDHQLHEEEVMHILGVKQSDAWLAMSKLARRGFVTHDGRHGEQESITLLDAGHLECLAIFGAVMLAGQ